MNHAQLPQFVIFNEINAIGNRIDTKYKISATIFYSIQLTTIDLLISLIIIYSPSIWHWLKNRHNATPFPCGEMN